MREVGNHRGARTISLALVAGVFAFEAALALGAGAVGIPGLFLLRFTETSGDDHVAEIAEGPEGGESVVAKLTTKTDPPDRSAQDAPTGEPRLDGLMDIPLQEWIREKPKLPEGKAFGAEAKSQSDLPWDAIEPVPLGTAAAGHATADATAALPNRVQQDAPPAPLSSALPDLPATGAVQNWIKAKAIEIKGEDRARPLYHFEFWLEPPDDVKQRLVAVSYEFNTPAVMPQSQISSERKTGFRVRTGGLVCAENVTVTLKFNDGRKQSVAVDSCRLLG